MAFHHLSSGTTLCLPHMAFHHLSNGTLCLVHLVFHRRSSGTLRPAHMAFHPRNRMASRRIICLHCSQAAHHFSRATRPAYQAYLFLPLHKQAPSHRIDKWNFRRRLPAINRPYSHLHMAQTRLNKAKRPQGRSQLRFAYAPCRGVARRCRPSRLNLSSPTPPQDTREGYPYHGRSVFTSPEVHGRGIPLRVLWVTTGCLHLTSLGRGQAVAPTKSVSPKDADPE